MPIYEYKCEKCGLFDKFERISAPPLIACPTCGGKVHRVISAPGIIFKGTGFYVTDNRSSDYQKDSSSASVTKSSSTTDSSSTAKPSNDKAS